MRVLLTETHRNTSRDPERMLRAAGHDVVRCLDRHGPDFPCDALVPGRTCPLVDSGGVDVVVAWRERPHQGAVLRETGVGCAVRRGVPLVVAGDVTHQPFAPWTAATSDERGLVAACERAAQPGDLSVAACRTVNQVLAAKGFGAAGAADAEVRRKGNGLRAVVTIPDAASPVVDAVAVRVAGALRGADMQASTIDVAVRLASQVPQPASHDTGRSDDSFMVPWAIGDQ